MRSKAETDAIAGAAQRLVERFVIPPHVERHRACLWYAAGAASFVERVLGERVILQGGSASWRRVRAEDDDGEVTTHYSYRFEWDERALVELALGNLPEMHCWLAVPRTKEIIDLSVKHQQEACLQLAGMHWPGDPLPEYLWLQVDEHGDNDDYVYRADRTACEIAAAAAVQCVRFNYPNKKVDKLLSVS